MDYLSKHDGEFWTIFRNNLEFHNHLGFDIIIFLFKDEIMYEDSKHRGYYQFSSLDFQWIYINTYTKYEKVIYKNDLPLKTSGKSRWVTQLPDILNCKYIIAIGSNMNSLTNKSPSTIDDAIRTLQSLPEKKKMNDFWIIDLRIFYRL